MSEVTQEDQIKALSLYFLSLLTLSYCGFQTFQGYLVDMGFANALVLSTILMLAMLILSASLRVELRRGSSGNRITAIVCLYMLAASFSFIGNFNSFYNALLRDIVIRDEIQEKLVLVQEMRASANRILSDSQVQEMRLKVETDIDQFKVQVQDPLNPGLGTRANAILQQIEQTLGQQLTRLRDSDKSPAGLKRLATDYETMIRSALDKSPLIAQRGAFEKEAVLLELNQKLKLAIKDLELADQGMTSTSEEARENAKLAIQKAVATYKESGAQLRRFSQGFTFNEQVAIKNTSLGRISHSAGSAISNLNKAQTWVALVLSLLIELFVPALVFALTPRGGRPDSVIFSGKKGLQNI